MSTPRVFVSTGGFRLPSDDAVRALRAQGIANIELSGGTPTTGVFQRVQDAAEGAVLQVHNYFPPPESPFVFNLCDPDPVGRERSIDFACAAIDCGVLLGSRVYSFHAGFLGTPPVGDLGRTWGVTNRVELEEGLDLFAGSVARVHRHASERGVELLVENNVLTRGTADSNGVDVLLMVTPDGIREALERLPTGVSLLVDVAHLKVSALTLGFDASAGIAGLRDVTSAYHLSDNDGTADTNSPVLEESWFWPYIDSGAAFLTLEIDPRQVTSFAEQVALTERMVSASGT